jgi:hypothetical protein
MIKDVLSAVRNELATIPDFTGVYLGQQTAMPKAAYPICWIEGGYGRRGKGALDEMPYIAEGKIWDEIYSFTVWIEIVLEDTEANVLKIYELTDKVRDKLRNNLLGGLVYFVTLGASEYPFVNSEGLLRVAPVEAEYITRRQI